MSELKDLQELLKKKREESLRLYTEIRELISRLQGICDHSETEPFHWEHDNGYGRQSMMTSKKCAHCGFVDLWNRGHFVSPKDINV